MERGREPMGGGICGGREGTAGRGRDPWGMEGGIRGEREGSMGRRRGPIGGGICGGREGSVGDGWRDPWGEGGRDLLEGGTNGEGERFMGEGGKL